MPVKQRLKGEVYRPNAKVLKLKGMTPRVLEISGNRYILDTRAEQKRDRRKVYENRTGFTAAKKERKA